MLNHIATAASEPQAAGVWDWANTQMAEARTAMTMAAGLVAIIIIVTIALKSKAVVPTLISIFLGAVLVFIVSGGLERMSGMLDETAAAPASAHAHLATVPDLAGRNA